MTPRMTGTARERISHMKKLIAPLLALPLLAAPAIAEPLLWGFQAEQFEYRERDGEDGFAWDFDLFVGRT